MKRILTVLLVLMGALSLQAQTFYKCTGDFVNVRSGPGLKYKVLYDFGRQENVQLFKDVVVKSRGKARNGFRPIICYYGSSGFMASFNGWVSAKYLKAMTKKCSKCNGKGYFNRPCTDFDGAPEEHPNVCSCHGIGCFHNNSMCKGKQHCSACNGYGYR